MIGKLGTCTELLPGAWITTSNLPLTGPVPVRVETWSVPRALIVQRFSFGTVISNLEGQRGVPSSANQRSGEVGFRKMTKVPQELMESTETIWILSSCL